METAASKRAIEAGPERGNPPPKYAASLTAAGSGGLFGALATYVAWTGLDEGYTPYLDEDYTIVEDPIVAAICAAKYYQRVVANYAAVVAMPGRPAPEDNYRVRLGWASPKTLKEDPAGSLFKAVKGRMDEDLAELGLKITGIPPPNADRWPGLKAVVDAMQSFPATIGRPLVVVGDPDAGLHTRLLRFLAPGSFYHAGGALLPAVQRQDRALPPNPRQGLTPRRHARRRPRHHRHPHRALQ